MSRQASQRNYSLPRADCPWCSRNVAVNIPRHGDGSIYVYRRHNNRRTGCGVKGGRREVPIKAITNEGAGVNTRLFWTRRLR